MAKLGQFADELERMTEQEVVEAALTHLAEQGVKSVGQAGRCAYKGDNDTCCGAGPFVKEYKPEMEDRGWEYINHTVAHSYTIEIIQSIHDNYEPAYWIAKFKERFPDVDYSFLENVEIHENCRS